MNKSMSNGKSAWQNWAGNLCSNAHVVAPTRLIDLQKVVRDAASKGKRIRPAGGSYSWAPLIPTDDVIVLMHHIDGMLDFDLANDLIEVEAGMTIEKLNAIVTEQKRTLVSPTLFPLPTVGGAIAGGCHGTNRDVGNFTDMLEEMTFVLADGSLRTVRKTDPDFSAAQVSLGTFGIIYSVKIKVVPQYNVRLEKRYLPVEEVIEGFEDLQASAEHLELFWFPFQPKMWVYIMNPCTDHPDKPTLWSRLSTDVVTTFENSVAGKMLPWIARHMPQFTPVVTKVAGHVANRESVAVQTASNMFHFQKAYPKCWDLSYSFPHEYAGVAWREGIDLVNDYRKAGLFPVNLPLHGRFTGASSALIAPDHARKTGYIEAVTVRGTPHWEDFFDEIEARWFAIPESRPHWCKIYGQTGEIAARYPQMEKFLEVRERWDPNRVFLNEFLEKEIFQLPPTAAPPTLDKPKWDSAASTAPPA